MQLVDRARAGDPRAIARLLSLVESASPQLRQVSAELMRHQGHSHVVGLTGPPGVGKSTTTSALIAAYRQQGHRVAVLAVDPSSPFSGGAVLGDRVRMQSHATDPDVFIRSMASRGHLGGLAAAAPQALRVLDACGFDVVLVETVGVGQSEVEVVGQTDTVLVLLAPGMGDGVQTAKAGILEIADVFVVNKADRDGVAHTTRDLRAMLSLGAPGPDGWVPPIITTVATRQEGIEDVLSAIETHRTWAQASGDLRQRRLQRIQREIEAVAADLVRERLGNARDLAERVLAGELDPYLASQLLTESL
ncbi:MAG: methylmalonyl Co-A mutase-associated GTPase MeaB [Candidatus Nanopelagicales bacterium]